MRPADAAPEAALSWRARRCAERPWLCLGVLLLELALSFGVYMTYGPWHSALVLVFLTAALTSWYGAFDYRLDPEGVTVRGPLGTARHAWEEFAACDRAADDVRLRFRRARRPPELVLHAPERAEQVHDYVAAHLQQDD